VQIYTIINPRLFVILPLTRCKKLSQQHQRYYVRWTKLKCFIWKINRMIIFCLVWFLLKKIIKLVFFFLKPKTGSNRSVLVWLFWKKTGSNRFGTVFLVWLGFFPVLARVFLVWLSFVLVFFTVWVQFGLIFFSFRLIKPKLNWLVF
jgi:hypothetical protein